MGSMREALRVQASDDVYERIIQKQRDAILQSEKKTSVAVLKKYNFFYKFKADFQAYRSGAHYKLTVVWVILRFFCGQWRNLNRRFKCQKPVAFRRHLLFGG
jgi:hypothetical protein